MINTPKACGLIGKVYCLEIKNTVLNIAYSELNKLKALGESHKSACLKVKLSSIRPVSLKIAF